MKIKIYYNGSYEDEVIIEAEPEDMQEEAFGAVDSRGWDRNDCWSEVIEEE